MAADGRAPERLTWLGHATVLLELGGARLLTDPVLRAGIAHLRRAQDVPPPPAPLDAVLISHLHHDHLDLRTLRSLDPSATLVLPRGAGRLRAIRRLGRSVHELAAGETLTLGDAVVQAVPAAHDGRRGPLTAEVAALGFVVTGAHSVYFAGDTELFDGMRAIAEHLDVALVPVAGWGPRLGPGHMDAGEAARAVALLRPAVAVPIHWGTYLRIGMRRRDEDLVRAAGREFARHVAEEAPDVRVRVLAPGESIALQQPDVRPAGAP